MSKEKVLRFSNLFIFSLVLFWAGWLVRGINYTTIKDETKEVRQNGFTYINPLLECDVPSSELFTPELKKINSVVSLLEKEEKDKNNITHLSVYFRDLNNGPWFGLNENDSFSPSSLLKVPIMIAVYKQAESDNGFLNKKVTLKDAEDITNTTKQNISPSKKIRVNETNNIDSLLEYMIIYSDNNAKNLLFENIDKEIINSVFKDLGIKSPTPEKREDFMSVKDYSSFFRILYNSSYLNREYSEKALEIMSRSEFTDGLRKNIPDSIVISHKFGERGFPDSEIKQLHDCGIVYYPNHPYLICIMTRGNDFTKLAEVISKTSKEVFDIINETYKK